MTRNPMTRKMTPSRSDERALRTAFGRFATGVTVITTADRAGAPVGLTANSFSSLSLDPPLVLWCLGKASTGRAAFEDSDGFVIHILAEAQEKLSRHFAADIEDRFAGLPYDLNARGHPLLGGACARFQCRTVAVHEGGDHLILVGGVEAFEQSDRAPLLFWNGCYHHVSPITESV